MSTPTSGFWPAFVAGFLNTSIRYAKIAAVVAVLAIIWYIAYQLFFSPLRSIAGPSINALTRTRSSWAEAQGDIWYWVKLHAAYGRTVRIGPTEVSFTGPQAWRDIHGTRDVLKDPVHWAFASPPGFPTDIALTLDTDNHRRLRSTFRPAFSEKMLSEQEQIIIESVSMLMHQLRARAGEPLDLAKFFNLVTFDIMHYLCFSERLGQVEAAEYTPWVLGMFKLLQSGALKSVGRKQPVFKLLTDYWWQEKGQSTAYFRNFLKSKEMIDRELERAEKGEASRGNLWSAIDKADQERLLDRKDIYMNAAFFMLAGTETSASALSALAFYLATFPAASAKLAAEIRSTFSSASDITMKSIAPLRYLNACLNEALRLYPPAAGGQPRVAPPEGLTVAGTFVPGGTRIYVHHLAAYRCEANYKFADEFHPERWLGDKRFKDDDFEGFKPFGYGVRNCIGENLAWHEMRLITASLLWYFDISVRDECRNWDREQGSWVVWEKTPLWMDLKPREKV